MRMQGIRAAIAILALWGGPVAAQGVVTHATFGGITGEAQKAALLADAEKMGIQIREERHGGWPGIRAHLTAQAPGWDIISIGFARCEAAAQADWVQPIDYSVVDKSKVPANLAREKYVGMFTFTYGIAYNKAKMRGREPKSWADFWNVQQFPGRRALMAEGLYALEGALIADGVAPEQVYETLKTPAGQERAFKKMEAIKPHINVWWRSPAQASQLLRDGEVDMVLVASSRARDLAKDGMDVGFIWNQAFIDVECFMVPKNAPNARGAMRMINSALDANNQAKHSTLIAYGPVNQKAFDTGILKPEHTEWLPTAPAHYKLQVYADQTWYASPAADAVYQRFSRFIQ